MARSTLCTGQFITRTKERIERIVIGAEQFISKVPTRQIRKSIQCVVTNTRHISIDRLQSLAFALRVASVKVV